MITIIEGVDGTGKSTFAERLAEARNVPLFHAGPPTHHSWIEEYVLPLVNDARTGFVLDRWHMGEMVWPAMFNRRSLFTNHEEFNRCNRILRALGAEVIVLDRDRKGISRTLKDRGEGDQTLAVLQAQAKYRDLVPIMQDHIPTRVVKSDIVHY